MLKPLFRRMFGDHNQRELRKLEPLVDACNALESSIADLDDRTLQDRTSWLRERLAEGAELDQLLPQAFATVREAARRTLGQRHFDVQLAGGIILHQGKIAEMKTGEGKTLVATLAVYLNALQGLGVHVVTVNDYLAQRDAAWMGEIYNFLGLKVGCIVHGLSDDQRRQAYAADVTYGTSNEFGFDYLRDNMKFRLADMVQRPFNFAIVDEVDSVLIDEARTPLIISGPTQSSSRLYQVLDQYARHLIPQDYDKDEKHRSVTFTEAGTHKLEQWLSRGGWLGEGNLYDVGNIALVHHANQSLRAHQLFERDRDYIVKDGKIVIIDEFTGRMMEGRRYSEGLHQALEAKEGVAIQRENQTLASITFQNYFRLYPKLAGMTGTALTEAAEFMEIYGLDALEVPTNQQVIRVDGDDEIYRYASEKNEAIVELIEQCRSRGQPVLVGTVSIEKSEALSKQLKRKGIAHKVLNARYHQQEAQIIAQAGCPQAVTIATNMAGRGTDIQLGGNPELALKSLGEELGDEASSGKQPSYGSAAGKVRPSGSAGSQGNQYRLDLEREALRDKFAEDKARARQAGGLYVIGTERHEARRIDNQLRGRSGRQGDPGTSKFFLSLEDDLMRIFGSERIGGMLEKLGMQEGEAIIHPWINKAVEQAQRKVEAQNFEIRKNLLKFDNVMNDQRSIIYQHRREIMLAEDVSQMVADMRYEVIEDLVSEAIPANSYPEQWDMTALKEQVKQLLTLDYPLEQWAQEEGVDERVISSRLCEQADQIVSRKTALAGAASMKMAEKTLLLQILDQLWKEHLLQLDHLRQGINLRAYGQRDPLNEYKREAFEAFQEMLKVLRERVTYAIMLLEFREQPPVATLAPGNGAGAPVPADGESGASSALMAATAGGRPQGLAVVNSSPKARELDAAISSQRKIPRNSPCPCGSGRKYKQCHGKVA